MEIQKRGNWENLFELAGSSLGKTCKGVGIQNEQVAPTYQNFYME